MHTTQLTRLLLAKDRPAISTQSIHR